MLPHLRCQHRRGEVQRLQKPAERPQQHPAAPQKRTAADADFKLHPAGRGLSAQVLQVPQAGLWRGVGQGDARSLCPAEKRQAGQAAFPPEGSAQLHPDGAVDDLEHGALPVVPSGGRAVRSEITPSVTAYAAPPSSRRKAFGVQMR